MPPDLTQEESKCRDVFRDFVEREVLPFANDWDMREQIPPATIKAAAGAGYLGLTLPAEYGGGASTATIYGLLHEELSRGCSSLRSIVTVHTMVAHAIARWGTRKQKLQFLPELATRAGASPRSVFPKPVPAAMRPASKQRHSPSGGGYILSGVKKWATAGEIADLYLVIARCQGAPAAFLVERESEGLLVRPIRGMFGIRAAMLAEIELTRCHVPAENLLGRIGCGVSHIATTALDLGRFSVATGCVGISQTCLEASSEHSHERSQFGSPLAEMQLIQRLLTGMIVNTRAARLICRDAGRLRDCGHPSSFACTAMAKYFASRVATQSALDALQIHGAKGCTEGSRVTRLVRDSRIMEIIEGSTQILETLIARAAAEESFGRKFEIRKTAAASD